LLEIDRKILVRKTGAILNFKITLISLHIDPKAKLLATPLRLKAMSQLPDKLGN
jgi:hypothetical protein